jgi:hypothetical protein
MRSPDAIGWRSAENSTRKYTGGRSGSVCRIAHRRLEPQRASSPRGLQWLTDHRANNHCFSVATTVFRAGRRRWLGAPPPSRSFSSCARPSAGFERGGRGTGCVVAAGWTGGRRTRDSLAPGISTGKPRRARPREARRSLQRAYDGADPLTKCRYLLRFRSVQNRTPSSGLVTISRRKGMRLVVYHDAQE